MNLEIITFPVTALQQNCRIIAHTPSKSALIIDPGGEAERILAKLKELDLTLGEIWLTHSHYDHCGGVQDLMSYKEVPLLGHEDEKEFRARTEDIGRMYGFPPGEVKNCPEPSRYLTGGEKIDFCGEEFEVRFCPGHSPGHLVFYNEPMKVLLAGDTLFANSIGRTDLPGGNHEQLLHYIQEALYTLPDETTVLPGHGPDTSIGFEKENNPFVRG